MNIASQPNLVGSTNLPKDCLTDLHAALLSLGTSNDEQKARAQTGIETYRATNELQGERSKIVILGVLHRFQ